MNHLPRLKPHDKSIKRTKSASMNHLPWLKPHDKNIKRTKSALFRALLFIIIKHIQPCAVNR